MTVRAYAHRLKELGIELDIHIDLKRIYANESPYFQVERALIDKLKELGEEVFLQRAQIGGEAYIMKDNYLFKTHKNDSVGA